jgi:hypothetical protein
MDQAQWKAQIKDYFWRIVGPLSWQSAFHFPLVCDAHHASQWNCRLAIAGSRAGLIEA